MRRKKGKSGGRPKSKCIGVIAEDDSDVQVINELIKKISNSPFHLRWFAAGGCGKIIGKANAWAKNLRDQGCKFLLLVQDLDQAKVDALRQNLVKALDQSPINPHLIVIPVREIEAWLLADHEAIKRALKLKHAINQIPNPESLQNAKEHLGRLVYSRSERKQRYINAIHNVRIAAACAPAKLKRCPSYVPFQEFIRKHI